MPWHPQILADQLTLSQPGSGGQIMPTKYRTRAIIGRSRFEAALVYKPRILVLKSEEFPFLVHKLSVIQAAASVKNG